MMYPEYDQEHIRQEIKQRYNRRFFLATHGGVLLLALLIAWMIPTLLSIPLLTMLVSIIAIVVFIMLVPHAIYVGYHEYQYWLDHKVDQHLTPEQWEADPIMQKQKRYAGDELTGGRFQLTDDGELEEVFPTRPDPEYDERKITKSKRDKSYRSESDHDEREEKARRKLRKKDKKRRKLDLDLDLDIDLDFDAKKIFKKLKDIID